MYGKEFILIRDITSYWIREPLLGAIDFAISVIYPKVPITFNQSLTPRPARPVEIQLGRAIRVKWQLEFLPDISAIYVTYIWIGPYHIR
jgi:hypothetical protein